MAQLIVSSKGLAWFRTGHPWIFRDDLESIQEAAHGGLAVLEKKNGEFLAQGFYSNCSKIAFRIVSRNPRPIDRNFWKQQVEKAAHFRKDRVAQTNAYRLVYGESDGLPSLIVDRYAEHFVLQTLTQGTENLLPVFTSILEELFRPSSITLRNDVAVRELEGMIPGKKMIYGECPRAVQVFEGGIHYLADLWGGQKTGAYLDQRENRLTAASLLRGDILDAFCYQGLFSLHVAAQGCRVIGVDSSPEALEHARENARLNGLTHMDFRKGNVFDFLKEEIEGGARFDGIILDPPAFAKSKGNLSEASRGYKELNLRALRLLKPGGILITSSCSYNLSEVRFLEILRDCSKDAGAQLRLIARRGQSSDHPVILSFPESFYLKCLILEKMS